MSKKSSHKSSASGRRSSKQQQGNPQWLVPTMCTLLVLGLLYLVVFYISNGQYPLSIGNYNMLVGFGLMLAGGILATRWK